MPEMTRRVLFPSAAALAGASAVGAACGPLRGRQDGSSGEGGPRKAGEVIRLSYLQGSADTVPVFQPIVDEFNRRNPGLFAELVVAQDAPFFEKLQAMIAAGTPPDGAHLPSAQLPPLASRGALRDLGPYIRRYRTDMDEVFPPLRAQGQFKDVQYGLARSGGIQGCYFNLTALRAAGLPSPTDLDARGQWTWESFLDLARRLTDRSSGETARLGTARGPWEMWFYNGGGELLNREGTKALMDSADAVSSIQFMADLIHRHRVAPANDEVRQANETSRFINGQLGFTFGVRGFIVTQLTKVTGFDPDLVAVPRGKAKATFGTSVQSVIPAGNRSPDEAFRFIHWFTSTEALKLSIVRGKDSIMPARRSLLESSEFMNYAVPGVKSPNINRMWAEELKGGRVRVHPAHPQLAEILDAVTKELAPVFADERAAREALTRAAALANGLLQAR